MIIKGLFRRYERWNPVHPTSGAFWGMGIGVGCGVGWGPGFGPEVIGYVGAGCGVGFSVGITLAGFGIGRPANFIFEIPSNAFTATKSGAMEIARSSGLHDMRTVAVDGWNNIGLNISGLKGKANGRFSSFRHGQSLNKRVDFTGMKSVMSSHCTSIFDCLEKFKSRFFHPSEGFRD